MGWSVMPTTLEFIRGHYERWWKDEVAVLIFTHVRKWLPLYAYRGGRRIKLFLKGDV
jgi:hypothetical protein